MRPAVPRFAQGSPAIATNVGALHEVVVMWSRTRVIGVEREYSVPRRGRAADGRDVWPRVVGLGARLDPGDPHASRDPWGGVATLDGQHLEVATGPVRLEPGCTKRAQALSAAGSAHLAGLLPEGHTLVGYSTHLSVEVDDRRVVAVARLVAERLSVPLALALDRRESPGLLVRPRPGRLEIGGEFASGRQLRAAAAMAVGVTLLAERHVGIGGLMRRLPPTARVRPAHAVERYGWYVDRFAHGVDLYATGRSTRIGRTTAGGVLQQVWDEARRLAAAALADDELHEVDALVEGRLPLPLEQPALDDDTSEAVPAAPPRDYGVRRRGDLEVQVVAATWWKATLQVSSPLLTRWVTLPGRALDSVLDALDAGLLDDDLQAMLTTTRSRSGATPSRRRSPQTV